MATAPPPPDWSGHQQITTAPLGRPAGFWIRFVAAIIDGLIMTVASGVLIGILVGTAIAIGGASEKDNPWIVAAVAFGILALIVMNWLYEALFTSSARGATWGKQAIGARIVRADGAQLSFGRATARYFAKTILTPMVPLGIGYMLAGWTKGKRALHDMVADTLVIRQP